MNDETTSMKASPAARRGAGASFHRRKHSRTREEALEKLRRAVAEERRLGLRGATPPVVDNG